MVRKLKNIKPLVIGIGVAGKRHLKAQLNLGIKTGIYSTNPHTTQFYKKFANVIVFDKLKDGINWSNLIHVCTPDDKHTEFVALALKKGKAVLCEKSFTTNLEGALYLQDLAHKYNATLIVGQNYRLTPTFLETRKRVLEEQLGKITKIETTYLYDAIEYQQRISLNKNKDFLYIGGSHAVDLAYWIANQPVESVRGKMKKHSHFPNSYDIILKFVSGLLCSIKLDASSPRVYNGTDLIVEGGNGKLVSHNKMDELLFYKKGVKKPQYIKLPNNKTLTTGVEVKITDDYLSGKKSSYTPLPDVDEAVNIIRVLDAIEKATTTRKGQLLDYLKPNLSIF